MTAFMPKVILTIRRLSCFPTDKILQVNQTIGKQGPVTKNQIEHGNMGEWEGVKGWINQGRDGS